MKRTAKFLIVSLGIHAPLFSSISIVYNLRVAETTKRQEFEEKPSLPSLIAITLYDQFRTKYDGRHQNIGAGLLSLIYSPPTYFIRADIGAGHVIEENGNRHASKTQSDDLLFSGGYSRPISNITKFTYSALLGIPTHRDHSLESIQFGYGHVGLGVQMDGVFAYISNHNYSVRTALRFIHFFPRNSPFRNQCYDFNVGNLIDIFIAQNIKWRKNSFEIGYNPSFFFDGKIHPDLEDAVRAANYIRNSFYTTYKRKFTIAGVESAVRLGYSFGFDLKPKDLGNKRMNALWITTQLNF